MTRRISLWLVGVLLCASTLSFADFKYSETSKITGGAIQGAMKFAGVFSKQARQATKPEESTIFVKGDRLRSDHSDGRVEIIDLDGRRMISIDSQKKTYSIVTFDQMKAALERAQEKAKAESAKSGQQSPMANVKLTPKVEVTPTGETATILNLPAHEVKMSFDMQMESTDPRTKGQSGTMWVKSDSWMTPVIPGSEEVAEFYRKMAKEINWVPRGIMGVNPQASQAMAVIRENPGSAKGFPLLQYVSLGMAPTGEQAAEGAQGQQAQSSESSSSSEVASPEAAIAKGLGGMFGGFGHKKKKKKETAAAGQPAAPPSPSGSLMDMTIQVTSYSNDSLSSSLFEVPSGYTSVPSDIERELGQTQ